MRLSSLLLLGATALVRAVQDETDPVRESTSFNGITVPPPVDLTPKNFDEVAKGTKWLFVKHYSPYCHHCLDFAPVFQTAYEFYYTSKPLGAAPDSTFTDFYDFRFAEINCVAFYDLCASHDVKSYPTTVLYKDGVMYEAIRGGKNISSLSAVIEKALEETKPKSRPANLKLPEPGAKTFNPDGGDAPAASVAVPAAAPPASDKSTDSNDPQAPKPAPPKANAESNAKSPARKPVKPSKPAKPASTPNEKGMSTPLSAEDFQLKVTMTQEPWFIKFYAPWCHHCQAMAPIWQQLSREMQGRLNIGEVNCDKESRLCKDVRLRGYPTVLFFQGGERVEYDGLRGLGDFVQYAERAIDIASGVTDVDYDSFAALEEKEEVIFIYFYDQATTSEDFMALERLPLSLIGRAKLVKTKDSAMRERFKVTTFPRLVVSREGRPTYYNPLTPREMRDVHNILNWMKSVWLPIVPELTASNAREVMDGKVVVLGILNRDDQEAFLSARREMKSAAHEWMDKQIQLFQLERQELRDAKQLRIEEAEDRGDQRALRQAKAIRINMDKSDHKEVAFAWVDGVYWQRWIRTTYGIDVKDGERVIINDEDNRRYWDQTITGNYILPSRTSILETIGKVVASPPKIKPKLTISSFEKVFFDMRVTFSEHPFLTLGCILGLAVGAASWFRGRLRRTRASYFRLDGEGFGMKEMKDGLLGGVNGNGKVD